MELNQMNFEIRRGAGEQCLVENVVNWYGLRQLVGYETENDDVDNISIEDVDDFFTSDHAELMELSYRQVAY